VEGGGVYRPLAPHLLLGKLLGYYSLLGKLLGYYSPGFGCIFVGAIVWTGDFVCLCIGVWE